MRKSKYLEIMICLSNNIHRDYLPHGVATRRCHTAGSRRDEFFEQVTYIFFATVLSHGVAPRLEAAGTRLVVFSPRLEAVGTVAGTIHIYFFPRENS